MPWAKVGHGLEKVEVVEMERERKRFICIYKMFFHLFNVGSEGREMSI